MTANSAVKPYHVTACFTAFAKRYVPAVHLQHLCTSKVSSLLLVQVLLLNRFLDGRVWPLEDELEVRLMIDLIRHVTGDTWCKTFFGLLLVLLPS